MMNQEFIELSSDEENEMARSQRCDKPECSSIVCQGGMQLHKLENPGYVIPRHQPYLRPALKLESDSSRYEASAPFGEKYLAVAKTGPVVHDEELSHLSTEILGERDMLGASTEKRRRLGSQNSDLHFKSLKAAQEPSRPTDQNIIQTPSSAINTANDRDWHTQQTSSKPSPNCVSPLNPDVAKRQFWHAGDYNVAGHAPEQSLDSMNHVRVHPKFLHSNATSHKWALGAIAELLDNSIDEVPYGATFCSVDVLLNPRNQQPMLLVEDDGGGMDPSRLRACMSLGYSEKSKRANTIGQYGNGFKTSTMRLGADALVFTRCRGSQEGGSPTQSVGLLSFTFLREMGHQDIVVPMVDYRWEPSSTSRLLRGTEEQWLTNLQVITQWCPYSSEEQLLAQFSSMGQQGTRVLVFNLWLADDGNLELDFDSDQTDIQLKGARDESHIKMASSGKYPNSHHFLTYRHSLRSYAAILYLQVPDGFRVILRGVQVQAHSIASDLMYKEEIFYKPRDDAKGMVASVKIGFVKDAAEHIDVQGFCVYHKNRLIKPFWRIWNAAGSSGRGVVGLLEANFVEPAHDKQGFERTEVLRKLEEKLLRSQKLFWSKNAHLIGYALGRASPANRTPPKGQVGRAIVLAEQPVLPLPEILALPPPPVASAGDEKDVKPDFHSLRQRVSTAPRAENTREMMERVNESQSNAAVDVERQRIVDEGWLLQILNENRELQLRCQELQGSPAIAQLEERLAVAEGRWCETSTKLRETEQALEQERGDRAIMVQQHRVAEEHLRARLKEALDKLREAELKLNFTR